MIDMKTLTDQQKRQLSRLLEMLETEKNPSEPVRWDRKYDNYGKYIVTLGMFEFYCKKGMIDDALHSLEETIYLYYPVGDLETYNVIKNTIKENICVGE